MLSNAHFLPDFDITEMSSLKSCLMAIVMLVVTSCVQLAMKSVHQHVKRKF